MSNLRIAELVRFAAEEGFKLPLPPEVIVWFEDHNCIVDLQTGLVSRPAIVGTPTPSGRAVNYLLS